MKKAISPNETMGRTDNESIQRAIQKAKETGINRVCIPRQNMRTGTQLWVIEEAIRLPSEIEIQIEDAHLRLADGVYTNMFINENAGTPVGQTPEGEQHDIVLRGSGRAVLDGGAYNGLSERNSEKDGRPHISKNTTILFSNVRNVTVENLRVINQRWWGITNIFVHHATFRNLSFRADFSRKDENGVHDPNALPRNYEEIYVKNADGIDLRVGCHHVTIENISGVTEDDTVALTALGGFEKKHGFWVEGMDTAIHDVTIRNVSADCCNCSVVRLLNDNGHKLYNITVDGVTHTAPETHCFPWAWAVVRIGDVHYADVPSQLGDTHHIIVRNVVSRARNAVTLCKGLQDSVIENITVLKGGLVGFTAGSDRNPDVWAQVERCSLRNILLESDDSTAMKLNQLQGELNFG